jgi:3-oxoacyl-[acyl-carrier-protein] synthase II
MAVADEIAITGVGMVSPVGGDAATTMKAMLRGDSGVGLLPEELWDETPIRLCGAVADSALTRVGNKERRRFDRAVHLGLQAAREAWEDARAPELDGARLAVVISCGAGGLLTLFREHRRYMERGYIGLSANVVPSLMANATAAVMATELGAHAGALSLNSACSSGGDAVAYARRLILSDEADIVLAGATEAAVHPLTLCGFAALRALSSRHDEPARASRPFDRDRDGFVLAEGSAVFVLERRRDALARRARVQGRLLATGCTSDGSHIVAPDPSGQWSAEAMSAALRAANLDPSDLSFVSAHATSTPTGDLAEWAALRRVFGGCVDVPVTAVKSGIGHAIGASAPIAMALAVLSLSEGLVPPTQNLENPDPDVELDVIAGAARPIAGGGTALVNSCAFGGQNVAIVVGGA